MEATPNNIKQSTQYKQYQTIQTMEIISNNIKQIQ